MKILIDMNLTPDWCGVFGRQGWEAVHWSGVGDPRAADEVILAWAADNGYLVFTHDLDFSAILAATGAKKPSVIQVRAQDVMPDHLGPLVVAALRQCQALLQEGALILIDETRHRARVLPLRGAEQQDSSLS